MLGACAMAVLLVGLVGCGVFSHRGERGKEHALALSDLPAPARTTVDRLTAGATSRKIDCERKGDRVVYDVEATVSGKDVEYDIDSSGNVLTSEQSVPYASLPAVVRAAAEKHFGTGEGLMASSELEEGKTFYEVEGMKGAAKRTLKLTEAGKIVEDEEK